MQSTTTPKEHTRHQLRAFQISGPDFVNAITGHPTALSTASKLLDERLERVSATSTDPADMTNAD